MIGACALGLMACGDDNEGGSLTIGTFPGQIVRVYCAKIFECCTAAEIADQCSFLASCHTQAECDSKPTSVFSPLSPTQSDVDTGRQKASSAAPQLAPSAMASERAPSRAKTTRAPPCGRRSRTSCLVRGNKSAQFSILNQP